jgi:hypothetical protein
MMVMETIDNLIQFFMVVVIFVSFSHLPEDGIVSMIILLVQGVFAHV